MIGGKRLKTSKSSSYRCNAWGTKDTINGPGTLFVSGDSGVEGRVESAMNVMKTMLVHKVYHDVGVNHMIEVAHYENLFLGLYAGMNKLAKMSKE